MSIHKPRRHDSGHLHVTGAARYTDDLPTPEGTLHLAFGTASIPHGMIRSMNLQPVREAPGVMDVITAVDIPGENDVSPAPRREPLLAEEMVFFHGMPLFVVIAETHLQARFAATLAEVDYEEYPAVISLDEAIEADNLLEESRIYGQGDVEAGFAACAEVLEGEFDLGGQEHFYLEGQAALAEPGEDGEIVLHTSTQHPSEIQHKVAGALCIPYMKVRSVVRRMGGGFGGKESQGNHLAVACSLAAVRSGRPCKMRYDRDDDMVITGKRHEFRFRYRAGIDAEGHLHALDMQHFVRCGWSQDLSLPVADRAMLHTDNAYYLPNVCITSHRLLTNTCSNTAFRGFGGPQGMVGIERVMDHIAGHLGRDPLEVRRTNAYRSGTSGQTTPYGQKVLDNIGPALVDQLVESAEYAERRKAVQKWNGKNPIIKKGISLTPVKFGISFTLTHLNQAGALVHVYSDGSIHLNHGGTEMGQGLFTKVAAVAAHVFGQPMEAVQITASDTAKVPNTSATAASSGSDLNGMATRNACLIIRDRLCEFAAERWQTTPDRVIFRDGIVDVAGEEATFAELIKMAYMARISLSAAGFYATPAIEWDRIQGKGRPFFYFAHGAAITEVALDTLTGENRILRTDILHDCGASLNPALDIGQIEGGYVQGAGWLTMEELVWHPKGSLWTHAPSTYKIPCASDRPGVFNVALWGGKNSADTIYRSKAVGEPPLMLGISAASALSHAVSEAGGDPLFDLPATPERLLMAIEAGW